MRETLRALIVGFFTLVSPAAAQEAILAPVESFARLPGMRGAEISPNGAYVAVIRRGEVLEEVVVVDLIARQGVVLATFPKDEGHMNWVAWKSNDRVVISATALIRANTRRAGVELGRIRGGEQFDVGITRLFAIDRRGGPETELFGEQMDVLWDGRLSFYLLDLLPEDPDNVLVQTNDLRGRGVWSVNVHTGRAERRELGDWNVGGYTTDGEGNVVLRTDFVGQNGFRYLIRAPGATEWRVLSESRRTTATATNSPDFRVIGSGPGAGQVYVIARPESDDLASLYLLDVRTGELSDPVQRGVRADVDSPWVSRTGQLLALCEFERRLNCSAHDPSLGRHLRAINAFFDNEASVWLASTSDDSRMWLLRVENPIEGEAYYIYDRVTAQLELFTVAYPGLDVRALSSVRVVDCQSRDGTQLWAYVTALAGASGPRPMVVMPHGGPESRDYYGVDMYAQFIASRGYVVVQPNFRGSYGSGRAFGDAGRGQWGARMQDDVTDAVRHMINSGVADPARICIVGGSYGGYAALAGITLTPELYRCAISIAGVSDLEQMLRVERNENGSDSFSYAYWVRSIGRPGENSAAIEAASPARHVDQVRAPLLLLHGDEDWTVPIAQSEIMRRAMERAGKPVRFVRLEGAEHVFVSYSDANLLTLYRETDAFLSQHLGPQH